MLCDRAEVRGTLDPANMQFFQLSYGQGPNPSEWFQIGERQEFGKFAVSATPFDPPKDEYGPKFNVIRSNEYRAPNLPSPREIEPCLSPPSTTRPISTS